MVLNGLFLPLVNLRIYKIILPLFTSFNVFLFHSPFLVVEPEHKAVATFVTHFTLVITDIVEAKWSHLPTLSKEIQKVFASALATSPVDCIGAFVCKHRIWHGNVWQ